MKNYDDKFLDFLDEMEFDTVELSKEELQRIHKMEMDKMEVDKMEPKKVVKPKFKWKMTSGLVAACLVMVVSASVIVPKLNNKVRQPPQVVNPCVEYNNLDSAEAAMGYDIMLPKSLPDGYKQSNITIISKNLLSIDYTNDINTIIYRTAQRSGDISGDYNIYTDEKIINVEDIDVTLRGNDNKIYLAIWETDGQTFSINAVNGISESVIIKIIESVEKI